MSYIRGGSGPSDDCFLCAAASSAPADDQALHVLARGRSVFTLLNRFPYNTGHVMVAPYRHVGDLEQLTAEESGELWVWMTRAVTAHGSTTSPDGFNVGLNLGSAAGAGVPGHLHLHVVPRWQGDTNFMPVVAGTKVLPEMLDDSYRTLRAAFDDLDRGGGNDT